MTQIEHDTIWLTKEAHAKLQQELAELRGPVRQAIIDRISSSRDEGDLKENGGYHAAKDEQGKVEDRIRQIEDMLRRAEVGTPADDGTVSPGMKVSYKYVGDDEVEELLLGAQEIKKALEPDDASIAVVSPQSPLGSAIIGARKGDTVTYATPTGKDLQVEIIDAVPYAG
jgi:transcription elongation factor GreA